MLIDQQLREVGRRIKDILKSWTNKTTEGGELPSDASLVLSIPGVGPTVVSTLRTEASRPIRERDYQSLRCYAGTAPIT